MDISVLVAGCLKKGENTLPEPIPSLLLQAEKYPRVEVLTFVDNGRQSLGSMRNQLLAASQGKYLSFLDVGCTIPADFIDTLTLTLDRAASLPDVVVYDHHISCPEGDFLISYGLEYEWWESIDGKKRTRLPKHCSLWRAELAKRHLFPAVEEESEFFWSRKIVPEARTQIRIDRPLCFERRD